MKILVWTDPHFTDNPIDDYRWDIFPFLLKTALEYNVKYIFCLGDLVNVKDRFSAKLVNRLIEECSYLQIRSRAQLEILSGNHDKPLTGPYYFQFLEKLGIKYHIRPFHYLGYCWLLPFSPNPIEEWKGLEFKAGEAVFMHQTGQGATVADGYELTSNNLPKFPKHVSVYSGDVHRAQEANGIVYIGTPHPVKFDEDWENRVLIVDSDDFGKYIEIKVPGISRKIITISKTSELQFTLCCVGDQVKIRYNLTADQLSNWAIEEEAIRNWAKERQIHLVSLEAVLVGDGLQPQEEQKASIDIMPPEDVIKLFSKQESLQEEVVQMGLDILHEANKTG